jgi:hypothetical protein
VDPSTCSVVIGVEDGAIIQDTCAASCRLVSLDGSVSWRLFVRFRNNEVHVVQINFVDGIGVSVSASVLGQATRVELTGGSAQTDVSEATITFLEQSEIVVLSTETSTVAFKYQENGPTSDFFIVPEVRHTERCQVCRSCWSVFELDRTWRSSPRRIVVF